MRNIRLAIALAATVAGLAWLVLHLVVGTNGPRWHAMLAGTLAGLGPFAVLSALRRR